MSADEMPCGCWGHADYEERCRYPKLEQDLSAERKRREGLEDELHLERLAHTAAVTRAEQAERELARVQGLPELEWAQTSAVIAQGLALHARTDQPAAKRMMEALDKAKTYVERLEARAEQAEQGRDEKADMLETALSQRRAAEQDRDDALAATARAKADNAALLRFLRDMPVKGIDKDAQVAISTLFVVPHPGAALLERMRALEKVRELLKDGVMGGHIVLVDECRELSEACKAADAMKETP